MEAVILGRADDDHATHTPAARAPRFTAKQDKKHFRSLYICTNSFFLLTFSFKNFILYVKFCL